MLLSQAKEGSFVVIQEVHLQKSYLHKMAALGIVPKEEIKIVKNDFVHPLIVIVHGCRLVIERAIANKIEV